MQYDSAASPRGAPGAAIGCRRALAARLASKLAAPLAILLLALGSPVALAASAGESSGFALSATLRFGALSSDPIVFPVPPLPAGVSGVAPPDYDLTNSTDLRIEGPFGSGISVRTLSASARSNLDFNFTTANASAEDPVVLLLGSGPQEAFRLVADLVESAAQASCGELGVTTNGITRLTNATIEIFTLGPLPLPTLAPPNTEVLTGPARVDGVSLIVNEQVRGSKEISVNAIHVRFTDFFAGNVLVNGDVILGHSTAQLQNCRGGAIPDLTVAKTHTGNFFKGQVGAQYTINVSNLALTPASGTITVIDTLPDGLTATAMAGSGWICSLAELTCRRNDIRERLIPYPPIILTVDVDNNASSPQVNTVTVSGGGESSPGNNVGTDTTLIVDAALPDLSVTKTHVGNFTQGQTGAQYTITVANVGTAPSLGLVTVEDALPSGLTATAVGGTNWNCTPNPVSCSRADSLEDGASYPPITLTVSVAADATSPQDNTVTVFGGGDIAPPNNSATDSTIIAGAPDLTVSKTHIGNFTQGQSGAQYSITVRNAGVAPTSGTVTLTDTLPAGLTATAIAGTGWTCTLATLTCTRADALAAAASYPVITLTVNVAANATSPRDNTVTVSGGGDISTGNNAAIDTTIIVAVPDLTVTKSHIGNFTQGQTGAQYSITVSNTGSSVSAGTVNLVDTLPTGLTATAISGTGWTCTLATLTCTRPDALAAGASYPVITLTVDVAANATSPRNNTVTVGGGGDVSAGNNSATDSTVIVGVPDLVVGKGHAGNFTQGQAGAQYEITVSNVGPVPSSGTVTLTDTLPAGLTATAIVGSGWSCTLATLACTRSDALAAGATYAAITLTVDVAANATSPQVNSATVSGGGDNSPANNSDADSTVIVGVPNLTVAKSHGGNFTQGQAGAQYSITASNVGAVPSTGIVTLTDTLPAGLTGTAIAGTGWTCVVGTLTCTRSDALAPGSSYPVVTLTVDVAANAVSPRINAVTVSGGGDITPTNNTASDSTVIAGVPNLTIAKSHTGNFTQGQSGAQYAIAVSNVGTAATVGTVSLADTLPAGLTATAIAGTGWTCTLGALSCVRADALAAGASYPVITLSVDVAANAGSPQINSATVSGGGDTTPANNTASDSTVIAGVPNLTVAKTHTGNFTQGQVGAQYSIAVSNVGTAATAGTVTLTDALPAGLTATAIAGAGWTCTLATLTCTRTEALAVASSFPAVTLTVDVAANATSPQINSVSVSGGGDATPANNTASDSTVIAGVPNLAVAKSHTGNFTQGQTGAQYSIAVSNVGTAASAGTVTLTDALPTGLTATAIAGTDWTCTLATLTCTRTDPLANGASYPPITLTVNVAADAVSPRDNTANVSGGGDSTPGNNTATDSTVINGVPDLTVNKSHTGNFIQGQVGAQYSIAVGNAGTAATSGIVTLSDALPTGLVATAMGGTGWTCTLATLSCTRTDALATGASYPVVTLTVDVAGNASSPRDNTVTVSGGGDASPGNNSDTDTTLIDGVPNLTVAKSHTGDFNHGQTGAPYSITVSNVGTAPSVGSVTLTDALPAGLTATSIGGTGWTCVLATLTCTRADALAPGASYPVITLAVDVSRSATSPRDNTATVSGGGDTTLGNNSDTDSTVIEGVPDLAVNKSHTGNFTQGQVGAQYTISVANIGTAPTAGTVTLADFLPAGLSATGIAGTGWSCTLSPLGCTRTDELANGASYPPITLTVTVADNAASPQDNTVSVSGGGDTTTDNNSDTDTTFIDGVPNLTVAKSHAGNFTQGEVGASYTITVSNVGTAASAGTVTLVDALPSGLTATAIAGTGWSCTLATLNCTRTDPLDIGTSYPPVNLTVNVAANADSPRDNTATVFGGGDASLGNNSDTDSTVIEGVPDLAVTKSHAGNFTQGQIGALYTIAVSNVGTAPSTGTVTLTDALPAGLTATAVAGTGWTCTLASLSCTRSDALVNGGSYPEITLTVDVASNASSPRDNTVTVSGGGDIAPGNNIDIDSTVIDGVPDLTVSKSHTGNFTQGQVGAQYSISVGNVGTAPSSGTVTLTDTLPSGLTATAISGTGWTCSLAPLGCTRTDALANGAAYPAITLSVDVAANASSPLVNTVTIGGGGDATPGNNSDTDSTVIAGVPDLTVSKSHTGNFTQGQVGAQYNISVGNAGTATSSGTVTLTDTLPSGLTASAISGTGWNCTLASLTCTRTDGLVVGASYPVVTLSVDVAGNAGSPLANVVTVAGGGDISMANNSDTDSTIIDGVPNLTVSKSHTGNFTQGQSGAPYSISVGNIGTAPSTGTVTLTDTLPTGLTAASIAGTGWTCTLTPLACIRSDALANGASFPAITLTVDVAANATSPRDNTATVSGGGDTTPGNNTDIDSTVIVGVPDLTVDKSHTGNFVQGQVGALYAINVSNIGTAASAGTVTLVDTLPSGLTATAIAGTGWSCTLATLNCARTDALDVGASYPTISLTVNVGNFVSTPLDTPATFINTVTVSGGGDISTGNNIDTDSTVIEGVPDLTVTKAHSGNFTQGQLGAQYGITVSNIGTAASAGTVTATDMLPAGLVATSFVGEGWNCTLATLSCTRSDALASGASYPLLTLTVDVAANAESPRDNSVTVSGGGDISPANNFDTDSTLVDGVPNLTVDKSHAGNFTQGQVGAQYSINVGNSGTAPTAGTVTLIDALPGGLTATAISGTGWSCTLPTLTCTRPDALAVGASYPAVTLTVDVAANATSPRANTVTVSGGGDTTPADNSDTDSTVIAGVPDLNVSVAHGGNFTQGQTGAQYGITVSNVGTAPSAGTVTATHSLPAGLVATSLVGVGWDCTLATLTCTRADALATGASYPLLTLTVNVAADASSPLVNTVTVVGGGDVSAANNTATDSTAIDGVPDLTVAVAHAGDFFQGQVGAQYGITVSNFGTAPSAGTVTATDTLPAGLVATSFVGVGWDCTLATLTCTRADALPTGASYPLLTLTVNVAPDASSPLVNTVTVVGGGDISAANNSSTDSTAIDGVPDLTVSKGHTGNFTQGQVGAQYVITVGNAGTASTTGTVTVSDILPSGLTATAISGTGWSCTLTTLNCERSDALANGGSFPVITLTVDVATDAASPRDNTVTVSGGGDTASGNNSDTDSTVIAGVPDLTVAKSHTGNFTQGQVGAQYSISVGNSGTTPTTGTVTLSDALPDGLTATALAGTGWACTLADLSCTRNDALAPGASYPVITLSVDVSGSASSPQDNTASVSGGGDISVANNSDTDSTAIEDLPGSPDLAVSQTHSDDFLQGQVGSQYLISVSNTGAGPTSGTVTVTDTLPAGLTATAFSGTGWTCALSTLTCTRSDALPAGTGYPDITLTVNVAADAPASVVNTVTVSGGGDGTPENNTDTEPTEVVEFTGANLTIEKSHEGQFVRNQIDATYTLVVNNIGSAPSETTVTVTDSPPSGYIATSMTGAGWTCSVANLSCTRDDALAGGASYPPITLVGTILSNAESPLVNLAEVQGGGPAARPAEPNDNTDVDLAFLGRQDAAVPVPTPGKLGLLLMALLVLLTGLAASRARVRRA